MRELLTTTDPVRLSIVRTVLGEAGIETYVFDAASPWPGAMPARLMISDDDEALARRVLQAHEEAVAEDN